MADILSSSLRLHKIHSQLNRMSEISFHMALWNFSKLELPSIFFTTNYKPTNHLNQQLPLLRKRSGKDRVTLMNGKFSTKGILKILNRLRITFRNKFGPNFRIPVE